MGIEGAYILCGAATECMEELLSGKDLERFFKAQKEVACDLMRRAGIPEAPMDADEVVSLVLGKTVRNRIGAMARKAIEGAKLGNQD